MYNQHLYELGLAPSVIRELFSYGIQKAAEVGAENIYDYSIGNPSSFPTRRSSDLRVCKRGNQKRCR